MDDLFTASYNPSTSSLVSTAAAAAGVPMKPEGGVVVTSENNYSIGSNSQRWQEKGRVSRPNRSDRDDIKKFKKMKIDKYDDFCEWVDGDMTFRYRPKDLDARKHLSGWAMRNTNNHNKKVLKKSCLGVFLCTKNCRNNQGELVTIRPATSDRARRKQMEKSCPRPGCDGKLYHVPCSGKNGYPVTHFWRVTDVVILFQSKGTHDHPRPDVVKTTSMAKMALLEYHRSHRHERPKEICRKVGIHLHKSFNRVDRVARQLREVQSGLPKNEKDVTPTYPMPRSYGIRSHVRELFMSPQKASEAEQYGAQVQPYTTRHAYPGLYAQQNAMDTWSSYQTAHPEFSYAPYPQADHINALQANSYGGYPASCHPEISQYEQMKLDYAACGPNYIQGMTSPGLVPVLHDGYPQDTPISHNPLDLVVPRDDTNVSASDTVTGTMSMPGYTKSNDHRTTNSTMLTPIPTVVPPLAHSFDIEMAIPTSLNTTMPSITTESASSQLNTPVFNSLKRPAPPDLQPVNRENKVPRKNKANAHILHPKTIKLKEHTPFINIDLSNFSDIFDMEAGIGEEGLAGRPKSPVYQAMSPSGDSSIHKDMMGSIQINKDVIDPDSRKYGDGHMDVNEHKHDTKFSGPLSSMATNGKTVVSKPQESPVFAQLSTHPSSSSHASANPDEIDTNNYLDKLVSIYLSKDSDKPISHLKNEFHVYTEKNGATHLHSKTLTAYRPEQSHYSTHEFFRAASTATQYESWCTERRNNAFRSPGPSSTIGQIDNSANYDYHSADHYASAHDVFSEQARYLYSGAGFTAPKFSRHHFLQNYGAVAEK